jgi:flagellar hook-associated protein 3 FlgL
MRITDGMKYTNLLRDINRARERVQNAQEVVSSGKKVNRPSDDPAAESDILRLNSSLSQNEQFTRTASFAQGKLQATDVALDTLENLVESAVSLAQRASSDPKPNSSATDLLGIRDQVMSNANTSYEGRFIFGGSMTMQAPYTQSGTTITYNGDSQTMPVQIGTGQTVSTQIPGNEIYTGPLNVFDIMQNLATAIQNGDSQGMKDGITALQQFTDVIAVTRSKIGSYMNLVSNVQNNLSTEKLSNEADLSNKQDADMAAAITELTTSQNGLQATLATGANISQLSLLNYMR